MRWRQDKGQTTSIEHIRANRPWLVVGGLMLTLFALAASREPTPMPSGYADGHYRNACCGDLMLNHGKLDHDGRRCSYAIVADAWTGSPLLRLRPGIAVERQKITVAAETALMLVADREREFGFMPPTAIILHENGGVSVEFERVDEPAPSSSFSRAASFSMNRGQ